MMIEKDVPIDYWFLKPLLDVAQDPAVFFGSFATRWTPAGLPALHRPKRKWRLPAQPDPLDYLEEAIEGDQMWSRNCSTMASLSDKVTAVLEDQAERGQVLKLTEEEARKKCPHQVIASLGANRKNQQESYSVELLRTSKEAMREKSKTGQKTLAFTAEVSVAHRQAPIAECDWYLLGCQVQPGFTVYVNKVGTFGVASAGYYWSRLRRRSPSCAILGGPCLSHVAYVGCGRLSVGGQRPYYRAALIVFFLLRTACGVPLSWNKTAGGEP